LHGFFLKIVRIVRISSENVRIFVRICSKKFWPPCDYDNENDNDNYKDTDYDNENNNVNFTFLRIGRSELIFVYILQVPEYSGAKDKDKSEDSVKSLRTYILAEHSPASMETVKVFLG